LQAVRESDGLVMAIKEEEIMLGQQLLAHKGYYVEPTSALVIAAMKHLLGEFNKDDCVLLPLTGNGLKGALRTTNPIKENHAIPKQP